MPLTAWSRLTHIREALLSGRFKALLIGCIAVVPIVAPGSAGAASDMVLTESVSWTDYVRALWPIIIVVAGLIGTGVILGLATRFPTVATFNKLKDEVHDLRKQFTSHEKNLVSHDQRIAATETYCAGSPSRGDLQEDIFEVSERMKGVEVGLNSVGAQINTMNTYLHTLIEKGLHRS